MAGCYGNSKEDRYFEAQLNRYLDSQDESYDIVNLTIAGDNDNLVDVEDELLSFLNLNSEEFYVKIDYQDVRTEFKTECFTKKAFEKLDDLITELVGKHKGKVTFDWK